MKLLHGDCLELMKELPDHSIDLCLTDPPYGITKAYWDKPPKQSYFDEIFRISKNQIIFGGHYFDLPKKDGWIVWSKLPDLKTTNECELIWTSIINKNKIITFRCSGNRVGSEKPDYKRPRKYFTSEKPVEFLELLLGQYSKENETIIDPFMGTGTCGQACKNLKRDFIGIELDDKHFELAKNRIENHQVQKELKL